MVRCMEVCNGLIMIHFQNFSLLLIAFVVTIEILVSLKSKAESSVFLMSDSVVSLCIFQVCLFSLCAVLPESRSLNSKFL